jgi:translocation and assembly module TamA
MALAPFGRYDVHVDSELRDEGTAWTVRYVVEPGPPTLLERVDIKLTGDGASDSGLVAIVDSLPFAEGDTLRHAPYEALKAQLQRRATNHGYFDARFDTAQIRVDRPRQTAEMVLHFDTGTRYRFGPITVEQDVLDPRYVDGYVTARQGDPFEAALLRKAQVDLTTGPWFGRADIKLPTSAARSRSASSSPQPDRSVMRSRRATGPTRGSGAASGRSSGGSTGTRTTQRASSGSRRSRLASALATISPGHSHRPPSTACSAATRT